MFKQIQTIWNLLYIIFIVSAMEYQKSNKLYAHELNAFKSTESKYAERSETIILGNNIMT